MKKDVSKKFYSKKKFNVIIHAAGIASPFYYRKEPLETIEVTIQGIKNCLALAKKNKSKLIYFSTSEYMETLILKMSLRMKIIMEMLLQWAQGHAMMKVSV